MKQKKHINQIISIAALFLSAVILLGSCKQKREATIKPIDRTQWPTIKAINIQSIISDSGIVKFKINAPEYEVYDKQENPYWDFKKGIKLENYNIDKEIDSQIECNYAKYFVDDKLWRLENNVIAQNIKGETFETELLFWDQKTEKLYSDKTVRITNAEEQIICSGFESNQNFTVYTFEKAQATFPVSIE